MGHRILGLLREISDYILLIYNMNGHLYKESFHNFANNYKSDGTNTHNQVNAIMMVVIY